MVRMSVIGLYNWDNLIFDDWSLPTGIDKEVLIASVLDECASFPLIHPDPDIFKAFLEPWSRRKLPIWTKLLATTNYQYDAIANYDRTEEHTETVTHTGTDARSYSDAGTETGTIGNTGSVSHTGTVQVAGTHTETSSGTSEEYKTGFNSASDQKTGEVDDSGTVGRTGTDTTTNNLTDTNNLTETRNLGNSRTGTDTRTLNLSDGVSRRIRAYGNIGTMTTQQMIEQERQIDIFDVYAIIVNDFIDTFCVQVY